MKMLWALAGVRGALVLEYGCEGHMLYAQSFHERVGLESEARRLRSTHLENSDIVFGGSTRLEEALAELVEGPADTGTQAVFLLPSSVPMVIGFDLLAVAAEAQERWPELPIIALDAGGFGAAPAYGTEQALLALARGLAHDTMRTEGPSANIIGICSEPFGPRTDTTGLIARLRSSFGLDVLNVMTADCSVQSLNGMGAAHLNLAAGTEALACARYLEQRFGTPWVSCSTEGALHEGVFENRDDIYKALERKVDP
jgi:nitrogenase molybdenum-iron protein alpha/beta subunit